MLRNNKRVSGFFWSSTRWVRRRNGSQGFPGSKRAFRAGAGVHTAAGARTRQEGLRLEETAKSYSAAAAMAGKTKWKAEPWSGPGDTQRRP
jgi:hypothetical protein